MLKRLGLRLYAAMYDLFSGHEHVRSADPRIAARQDKIPFPYPLIGCHPNRDTLREIKASPLDVESVRAGELPKAPKIERPMIVGTARRPATA